jgi:tungstate transport system ATP-binding protein
MLRRSVGANVAVALKAVGLDADRPRVLALLDRVGLAALVDRSARRLSGGEQQRLALARALARSPRILFLDEPTASLDPAQTKIVEEIIGEIAASGVKIVMATHNLGQTKRTAGDVVVMVKGRAVEHARTDQLFKSPSSEEARRFLAGELVL